MFIGHKITAGKQTDSERPSDFTIVSSDKYQLCVIGFIASLLPIQPFRLVEREGGLEGVSDYVNFIYNVTSYTKPRPCF